MKNVLTKVYILSIIMFEIEARCVISRQIFELAKANVLKGADAEDGLLAKKPVWRTEIRFRSLSH